jgi:hypothetical protein
MEETKGSILYAKTDGLIKDAFMGLLEVAAPKGQKMDGNVQQLLAEINTHLRDVMYRVVEVSNLVDRAEKFGDRVDAPADSPIQKG